MSDAMMKAAEHTGCLAPVTVYNFGPDPSDDEVIPCGRCPMCEVVQALNRVTAEKDQLYDAIRLHRDHLFPEGSYTVQDRLLQIDRVNQRLWSMLDD